MTVQFAMWSAWALTYAVAFLLFLVSRAQGLLGGLVGYVERRHATGPIKE